LVDEFDVAPIFEDILGHWQYDVLVTPLDFLIGFFLNVPVAGHVINTEKGLISFVDYDL
jgi:hypothetical protein